MRVDSSQNISPTLTPNRLRNEVKLAPLYIEYKIRGIDKGLQFKDTLPTKGRVKTGIYKYDTHSTPEKDCRSLDYPNTTGPKGIRRGYLFVAFT